MEAIKLKAIAWTMHREARNLIQFNAALKLIRRLVKRYRPTHAQWRAQFGGDR
jgi:hypothetical protein